MYIMNYYIPAHKRRKPCLDENLSDFKPAPQQHIAH